MVSPQLLEAAIQSDGVMREAPYTLLCMIVAVEKANTVEREEETDVAAIYSTERDVNPFERLLQASDEFSLHKNFTRNKKMSRRSSVYVQMDLERLMHSTSRLETNGRLERQLERLRLVQIWELTGVLLPKHLQLTTFEEDPVEFRRDIHGIPQVWGRNVLGEYYAPTNDPLSFLHKYSVSELFRRMKYTVREDLRTRDKRRIAALNAKEKERQKELERQGILSPEQQLEAKFDRLLNTSVAS